MIATVRGTVVALGPASAVVEASGVGYAVQATPSTLAGLREGVEVLLHTSLVVREDSMTLFGFADRDEREAGQDHAAACPSSDDRLSFARAASSFSTLLRPLSRIIT